jgi:hypothetical protein
MGEQNAHGPDLDNLQFVPVSRVITKKIRKFMIDKFFTGMYRKFLDREFAILL